MCNSLIHLNWLTKKGSFAIFMVELLMVLLKKRVLIFRYYHHIRPQNHIFAAPSCAKKIQFEL